MMTAAFRDWMKQFRPRAGGPAPAPCRRARRRQDGVEVLESRIAPATFTGVGTSLTINLSGTNESVSFSTDGAIITATLAGGTVIDGTGTGGNVAGFGTTTAQIT